MIWKPFWYWCLRKMKAITIFNLFNLTQNQIEFSKGILPNISKETNSTLWSKSNINSLKIAQNTKWGTNLIERIVTFSFNEIGKYSTGPQIKVLKFKWSSKTWFRMIMQKLPGLYRSYKNGIEKNIWLSYSHPILIIPLAPLIQYA